jgi:hypothetical protein
MPVGRLVRQVADKHQVCTQRSWKRPFGVGMLVGGYDKTGPHLYNTCPSGNYDEYKAMAIGARSQVGSGGRLLLLGRDGDLGLLRVCQHGQVGWWCWCWCWCWCWW